MAPNENPRQVYCIKIEPHRLRCHRYLEDKKKEYRFMAKTTPNEFTVKPVEDYDIVVKMICVDGSAVFKFPSYENYCSYLECLGEP